VNYDLLVRASKVTGWFENFESAALAVVPQTTLTVQQKTSIVAPL